MLGLGTSSAETLDSTTSWLDTEIVNLGGSEYCDRSSVYAILILSILGWEGVSTEPNKHFIPCHKIIK
jgi:hypothetical protein